MAKRSDDFPPVEIRFPYRSYPRIYGFSSDEPSMTKQSFKDECDINVIMRRYEATGVLPTAAGGEQRFLDVSGVDYQEAMLAIAEARTRFEELPARVRDRFQNDPARLLEFLDDPRNVEEGRKLGLLAPEKEEATPVSVRVVDAPVGAVADPEGDQTGELPLDKPKARK